jgi:hypothetical protein
VRPEELGKFKISPHNNNNNKIEAMNHNYNHDIGSEHIPLALWAKV